MSVNRYHSGDDKKPECPNCGFDAFCVIKNGGVLPIDTVGTVYICSTEDRTYIHSWTYEEVPEKIKRMADR